MCVFVHSRVCVWGNGSWLTEAEGIRVDLFYRKHFDGSLFEPLNLTVGCKSAQKKNPTFWRGGATEICRERGHIGWRWKRQTLTTVIVQLPLRMLYLMYESQRKTPTTPTFNISILTIWSHAKLYVNGVAPSDEILEKLHLTLKPFRALFWFYSLQLGSVLLSLSLS